VDRYASKKTCERQKKTTFQRWKHYSTYDDDPLLFTTVKHKARGNDLIFFKDFNLPAKATILP